MEGRKFVDFIAFLPVEISENILCRLMGEHLLNEDFTTCRLVCKNWNSKILSMSHLWKVACEKLGLNVRKDTEVDYKAIFLRMRKRFQQIKNGGEFFHVDSINIKFKFMYYHNGIVAAANYENSIHILESEPKLRVVSEIHMETSPSCIYFDDEYLVVGTKEGYVTTFKMPTMEKLYTKMAHRGPISCVTFNRVLDLVVTFSDKYVTLLCLSLGTLHFTRIIAYARIFLDTLHIIPSPGLQDGCDYMLVCIDDSSCFKLLFDSQQLAPEKMFPFDSYKLDRSGRLLFSSYYFRNPFIYFVNYLRTSQVSTLVKYNALSGKFDDIGQFNFDMMGLIGVGRKYACFLQRNNIDGTIKVIIYDLTTQSEFTSFVIPGYPFLYLHFGICLDHASWLDGFDGFNDKGVFIVMEVKGGTCDVLKWLE